MKQLTKNFNLSEFLYSKWFDKRTQALVIKMYNETNSIQHNIQKLANQLQTLRDHLSVPITINIAYRPVFYELSKGRDGTSQHTLGKAADITAQGLKPKYVAAKIEQLISSGDMIQGGLGVYSTFVHYDIFFDRTNVRRW
jgi:uncharacterized protein YcbK (DUF882 family)